MNQLEHLKALRDKARIQTEQAEAVLKQQGEISESLDRLIAALEETDDGEVAGIDKTSLAKASGTAMAAVGMTSLIQKDEDSAAEISDMTEGSGDSKDGEVVESLGQLIANLEETPDDKAAGEGSVDAASGIAAISNAGSNEAKADQVGDEPQDRDSVEWISDEGDEQATQDEKPTSPRLEPIVWEVSDTSPSGAADESESSHLAEAEPSVPVGEEESPGEEAGESGYQFVKLGEDSDIAAGDASADDTEETEDAEGGSLLKGIAVAGTAVAAGVGAARLLGGDDSEEEKDSAEVSDSDKTAPVPTLPPPPGVEPVTASVNEIAESEEVDEEEKSDETESAVPPPVPVPSSATPPVPVPAVTSPGPVILPPVPKQEEADQEQGGAIGEEQFQGAHSANIFFDANSAYLKESELTKLKAIADAVAGSEARVVKIQGLEDLASSNDFKELLASRRLLAVRKRLADHGLDENQLTIGEIKLSEEGRVLEPPSISMVPA